MCCPQPRSWSTWDVHTTYGHTDVLMNHPAIAPVGEAWPNTQIFRELAARNGL